MKREDLLKPAAVAKHCIRKEVNYDYVDLYLPASHDKFYVYMLSNAISIFEIGYGDFYCTALSGSRSWFRLTDADAVSINTMVNLELEKRQRYVAVREKAKAKPKPKKPVPYLFDEKYEPPAIVKEVAPMYDATNPDDMAEIIQLLRDELDDSRKRTEETNKRFKQLQEKMQQIMSIINPSDEGLEHDEVVQLQTVILGSHQLSNQYAASATAATTSTTDTKYVKPTKAVTGSSAKASDSDFDFDMEETEKLFLGLAVKPKKELQYRNMKFADSKDPKVKAEAVTLTKKAIEKTDAVAKANAAKPKPKPKPKGTKCRNEKCHKLAVPNKSHGLCDDCADLPDD